MQIRSYKISIAVLACLLVWCFVKYIALRGKEITAGFVSHQGELLRWELKNANSGVFVFPGGDERSEREAVLSRFDWYIDYYDHRTNALKGSEVLWLLSREREYLVRDTIQYLRRTGTNDYGDDPYEWLRREYNHP